MKYSKFNTIFWNENTCACRYLKDVKILYFDIIPSFWKIDVPKEGKIPRTVSRIDRTVGLSVCQLASEQQLRVVAICICVWMYDVCRAEEEGENSATEGLFVLVWHTRRIFAFDKFFGFSPSLMWIEEDNCVPTDRKVLFLILQANEGNQPSCCFSNQAKISAAMATNLLIPASIF